MNKPKKKDRCECYDNGNKPAILTDFHSGSNICGSCKKPLSSELKIYNQCCDKWETWLKEVINKKEIYKIILQVKNGDLNYAPEVLLATEIAKAIYNNLTKEK